MRAVGDRPILFSDRRDVWFWMTRGYRTLTASRRHGLLCRWRLPIERQCMRPVGGDDRVDHAVDVTAGQEVRLS